MGRDDEQIVGRVIASEILKIYGGGSLGSAITRHKYVVEYRIDGGAPMRAELKQEWGILAQKMINPPEGRDVPLLLNRASGEVRFDADDPRINFKASLNADKAKGDAAFKKKLDG